MFGNLARCVHNLKHLLNSSLLRSRKNNTLGISREFLDQISQLCGDGYAPAFIYVHFDIPLNDFFVDVNGEGKLVAICELIDDAVKKSVKYCVQPSQVVAVQSFVDGGYLFLTAGKKREQFTMEYLHDVAERIKSKLDGILKELKKDFLIREINAGVGYSILKLTTDEQLLKETVFKAVKEAGFVARHQPETKKDRLIEYLNKLINEKLFEIVFQPIVKIPEGRIFGYEALTRLPEGGAFSSPLHLFNFASETGYLYCLEKETRDKALNYLGYFHVREKLFLNVNPRIILDTNFIPGQTLKMIDHYDLSPDNIVFELTEWAAIDDYYVFLKTLDHYRNQGFLIAIDDFGAGYSNLRAIAELQPDFIKLDMSLVRGINEKPVMRELVETFLSFAQKTHSQLVAEGVETQDELEILINLGIPLAQGYFLGYPGNPPPALGDNICRLLETIRMRLQKRKSAINKVAGVIAQKGYCIDIRECTKQAVGAFVNNPALQGVVVTQNGKPAGLIMRDKLFSKLATQYGYALYMNRPVSLVMDPDPLVVCSDTPLETVSHLAMNRKIEKVYDYIIVAAQDVYYGVVSVQQLLDAITQKQIEIARLANPLTSLPGNLVIQDEISARIDEGQVFALIYGDLDNFKAFNDYYGFERGDQVIMMTARLFKSAVDMLGNWDDFVGHVGGDDFVIITTPDKVDAICQYIINNFDEKIPFLYQPEDREKGYIVVCDRQGVCKQYPLVSISLAVVINKQNFRNYLEITEVAAEVKKYVKSLPGSAYARDRRRSAYSGSFRYF